ncbi:MAG: type II secretion system protein GspH [Robiginitomaculum sp.]|nr:MAG: type II secretion system protein GspH [Robiginitomaculum sp.]
MSRAAKSGSTLAELLVVLVIIGLISAVLAPRLMPKRSGHDAKNAAFQLAKLCRDSRKLALISGISQQVQIDTQIRTAWITGQSQPVKLGRGIELETITAQYESAPGLAGIRFFADGTSTGGQIRLFSANTEVQVAVNWANAEVRIEQIY